MVKRKMRTLAAMLAVVMLAGCGNGAESGSTTAETGEAQVQDTAGEPVEIEFWYGLGGTLGETVEALISIQKNPFYQILLILQLLLLPCYFDLLKA